MKIKLNDGSFILEKDNTEIDVFEKLNGGIAILGENIPDNYIVGEDNNAYRVLPDNNIVPVSHPDLSTQPSILPYRFGSMPINEVLIANGREDEIPSDAMVIEAFSFNKDICVPAIVEKNYKEEHKYTIDINFELPKLYRDFTENDAITFSDVPTIEDINNFLIFYQNDSSFITTKEYEGQSEIYFSIKNTMGGTPFASFLWIKDSNVLTYYHESTSPSQGPTFTKIEYNKPPKVITHKIYIRNSESIIPDFTLIKYIGKPDDYYYNVPSRKIYKDLILKDSVFKGFFGYDSIVHKGTLPQDVSYFNVELENFSNPYFTINFDIHSLHSSLGDKYVLVRIISNSSTYYEAILISQYLSDNNYRIYFEISDEIRMGEFYLYWQPVFIDRNEIYSIYHNPWNGIGRELRCENGLIAGERVIRSSELNDIFKD